MSAVRGARDSGWCDGASGVSLEQDDGGRDVLAKELFGWHDERVRGKGCGW